MKGIGTPGQLLISPVVLLESTGRLTVLDTENVRPNLVQELRKHI